MDALTDLAKIILPAALVLYGMYLTVNSFLNKEFQRKLAEIKLKNTEVILTGRLQAYERMCLFLERISPENLLLRINANSPELTADDLHQIMLHEIRNEFSHNLSQQIYMSDETWVLIRNAKEEVITLINNSVATMHDNATSLDLAKQIFENIRAYNLTPIAPAMANLKEEVMKLL